MNARAVPVMMFHSIAPAGAMAPHGWLERITEPLDLFEAMLEDWRRRGVRTVGSRELAAFLAGTSSLPPRSVVLTLDDGYLDNWVALTPLLRRYGQKAIVFMSTDFIDPATEPRPTLDGGGEDLPWQGYLSRPELKAMASSEVVEIHSHARSHTWLFTGPRIIDFYGPHWNISHPRCRYRFLWLNRNRERKPFALQHLKREAVPWGTPVYEFAPALVAREYRPDPALEERLVGHVMLAGGEEFFRDPDWRQHLERLVADHRKAHPGGGDFESEEERLTRVRDELAGSRAILEEITGEPVTFFSPPQGGADSETLALALECGYELVTSPSGGSVRLNLHGSGERWVYRCGTGFDMMPRGASHGRALLSQRITLARYAGTPGAGILTRGFGALNRVRQLLDGPGRASG